MYSHKTRKLIESNDWDGQCGHQILESILQKLRTYPLSKYYLRTYTIYTRAYKEVLNHPETLISTSSHNVGLDLLKNTITFASGITDPII
ncbi:MAG: hypothetical protein HRT70_05385 [Flavobacteriaceae bacterium]|nr:hypothetical protein [Flavobacteriaceae bacterium]